jgi:hypothetical protein
VRASPGSTARAFACAVAIELYFDERLRPGPATQWDRSRTGGALELEPEDIGAL